jgi:hypothetical protein
MTSLLDCFKFIKLTKGFMEQDVAHHIIKEYCGKRSTCCFLDCKVQVYGSQGKLQNNIHNC